MAKPIVLVTSADLFPKDWVQRNWPSLPGVAEIRETALRGGPDVLTLIAEADVLFRRNPFEVTREVLAAGTKLSGVISSAAGFDGIDVEAATELGIAVANSPGNTNTIAEATLLLILALNKRLPFWQEAARSGKTVDKSVVTNELGGRTLGIVGFGRIGRRVAQLARAFDMRVLAWGPRLTASDVAEVVPFDELLRRSDYVSLHASLDRHSERMIGADQLALMKPSAVLINTARGELVDEAALIEALRNGTLAGAGLDVFEVEPPRADNPLVAMPNVIATPHRLGHAVEARKRSASLAEQSILSLIEGRLPELTVNRDLRWRFG